MRSLWISILSLAILISIWGVFFHSSHQQLTEMTQHCQGFIMEAVEQEDWEKANTAFSQEYQRWHEYRRIALFFLDTQSINETDQTFAKTLKYIKAEDRSNSSGELLSLTEQLKTLHENESITWQNIL
ncbi:DUF4363 family protein [Ihubacter sp. mB4P-1]|uniref:DUF4363 family protein n=2 Tax=unclassified Ihubacter TaxID=2633299 RepID=UPI0013795C0E